jgi:hypothetical protein
MTMLRRPLLALLFTPVALMAGPDSFSGKQSAPAPRTGYWRVSGGFMHRSLEGVDWLTGTESTLPMLLIGPGSNTPGIDAIGPADAFADRTYSDGFVRQDAGTPNGGDTWNWGYDNASQVVDGALLFHGGNGTAATFSESSNYEYGGWSSDLDGAAPFVKLEWIMPQSDTFSFGWQSAFSYLGTDASRALQTFTAQKTRTDYGITYTDRFDAAGVIIPQAPYAGGPQGPGPLLPNIPTSRTATETVIGGEIVSAVNDIRTNFDLSLSTLSFGPTMEYRRGALAFQATAGVAINVASWDAQQTETLRITSAVTSGTPATVATTESTRSFQHSRSHTDIVPGLFLEAAASRDLNQSWSLSAFGRYDWAGDVDFSAGPSTGSAGLSGWSLGVGVGFRF